MNAKRTLISTIVVLTLVAAGFAIASKGESVKASPEGSELQQTQLPREWVWKKKEVTFDHMYRR
jgi:hypothetical protein